jgi:phenylpropionate dioxygenase-like ring-hydroxylating dioxygenase large terminal subunit
MKRSTPDTAAEGSARCTDARPVGDTPLGTVDAFLKNTWYVAAWSHEVTPQGLLARTVTRLPLLLWRDRAGRVIAFEDRCCHRAAPLSKGRREGDRIRCMYHGLLFDATGRCVEIPSQDFIPPAARVRAFPVVERFKWIWVWMGDPERADETLIPDTHYLDDPLWRGLPGYMHYDANYLLITDNLLDFSHLSYVHETTLGGSAKYAAVRPKLTRSDRSIRVERWLLDDEPAPFVRKLKTWPGHVDRWNIYDVVLPGVLLMDSGSAPAGTGAPEGRRVDAAQFFGCQAVTPETERTTHYFFQQCHGFALDDPKVTETLDQSVRAGFLEDKDMILAQQRILDLDPDAPMLAMRMDTALASFRTLLEKAIAAERAPAAASTEGASAPAH